MIRRSVLSLLTILAMVSFASLICQAQAQARESSEVEAWKNFMKQLPLPDKGCFNASFPSLEWRKVACTTAPNRPFGPARGTAKGARSFTVGDGIDFSGLVSGLLSKAEGFFTTASFVTSSGPYSLQLNANTFTTSVCNGAANPSLCSGWQQFVYSSSPTTLFMQYWLLNWGKSCPSGWTEYTNGTQIDCYKNSSATTVPIQPIANLPQITLTGQASGATDTVLMTSPGGNLSAMGADTVLNLEHGWNTAEYNVFGNCCGSEYNFNTGAALVAQVNLTNGTTATPTCASGGFTGETNNLSLVRPCCSYGGATPAIEFLESNGVGTASCGATAIQVTLPLACTAAPSCSLQGSGPGEVVTGQVVVSCNKSTLITASATICGTSCVTDSVAPPQPTTSLGAGDATRGTSGSCALSWSWGGNNYGQTFNVP
jgi:hypothetical protein